MFLFTFPGSLKLFGLFRLPRSAASCLLGFDGDLLLFEAQEPQTTPFGQGHGLDVPRFNGGDGLELVLQRGRIASMKHSIDSPSRTTDSPRIP